MLWFETDPQSSQTTQFPFMSRDVKNADKLFKLNIALSTCIINGNSCFHYIQLPLHGKNSNNSITIRFMQMMDYCKQNGGLPGVLKSKFFFVILEQV